MTFKNKKTILSILLFWIGISIGFSENKKMYSIEELFQIAENNNSNIKLSELCVKESEENIKVENNAWLPTINLDASVSYLGDIYLMDRKFQNGQRFTMPHFGNNFAIEATQLIYAGGVINATNLAKLNQKESIVSKEETQQNIRFMIVSNYLELFRLRNQIEVLKKNIEQTNQLLTNIRAKEKEGLVLKNDITRHELRLQELKLDSLKSENNATIINNQLAIALHLPPETRIEIDKNIINNLPIATSENEWLQNATLHSIDLQKKKIAIEKSQEIESLSQAEYIPSIVAFIGNKLDGPITVEIPTIDKNINYWYAGIGIKWEISSFYKSTRKHNQAKWQTKQAKEAYNLQEENLTTKIHSAYIQFTESFQLYDTQKKSLELALQNYHIINHRYLNDLAIITEILDATTAKLNAEIQVVNAQINILFRYYYLKKIAGTI